MGIHLYTSTPLLHPLSTLKFYKMTIMHGFLQYKPRPLCYTGNTLWSIGSASSLRVYVSILALVSGVGLLHQPLQGVGITFVSFNDQSTFFTL